MNCELTIDGLEMCLKNSIRLLKDSSKRGLSLPTVGAIVEIGLEEAAKAFLIMFCLMKNGTIKEYSDEDKNEGVEQSSLLRQKIKEFVDEFNCSADIDDIFIHHEVKTKLIRKLGSFLQEIETHLSNDSIRNSAVRSLKNFEPKFEEVEINRRLSDPKAMLDAKERIEAISRASRNFSSKIKEQGFYVDCENHSFTFPSVSKRTIKDLSGFLFALIYTILQLGESSQVKFKSELNIKHVKGDFSSLQNMLE